MADMYHLIQAESVDDAAAYAAVTTREGITGWWTSRAEVPGAAVGDVLKITASPQSLAAVRAALEGEGVEIQSAELAMEPNSVVEVATCPPWFSTWLPARSPCECSLCEQACALRTL